MSASCNKPGCGREWPRDPTLEVECPTCHAPIGKECKRPSGHRVFGGEPHPQRDLLADREGHYGVCPLGSCGAANKPQQGTLL
jgi:hypothetical protein